MAKLRLRAKDLRAIGYENARVIQTAMMLCGKHYKNQPQEEVLDLLAQIAAKPSAFLEHETLAKIAEMLDVRVEGKLEGTAFKLRETAVSYKVYGAQFIEEVALQQMENAVKLPISVAGALMPDAHGGYGLPIGGVLATDAAVIPYGVGMDIGCRMCLSVFDIRTEDLTKKYKRFLEILDNNTKFGTGEEFRIPTEHEIFEDVAFTENPFLKSLQYKAYRQLGSSGSGNHFVEFGIVDVPDFDETLGLKKGKYLGLLSHSGSRGLGANIAQHYTKIAMELTKLPKGAEHLAWLDLNNEYGAAYWQAMNLAGDYASACHHTIHDKIANELGEKAIKRVENHHNFAWKEVIDGRELIVHRKGATPAGKNVLGIIPGSMTAAGYIVKGKGETGSLLSAAHGAGRAMSRSKAMKSITQHAMKEMLKKHDVKLIGGGIDEAPMAYKDIEKVMQSQHNLVDIIGSFLPKIVKMDGK